MEKDFKKRRERILKNAEKKDKNDLPEISPSRGEEENGGARAVDFDSRKHFLLSSTPNAQPSGKDFAAALPSQLSLQDAPPAKSARVKKGVPRRAKGEKKKKMEDEPKAASPPDIQTPKLSGKALKFRCLILC